MNNIIVKHACTHVHNYIVPNVEINTSRLAALQLLRCPKCIASTPTKARVIGINRGKELATNQ